MKEASYYDPQVPPILSPPVMTSRVHLWTGGLVVPNVKNNRKLFKFLGMLWKHYGKHCGVSIQKFHCLLFIAFSGSGWMVVVRPFCSVSYLPLIDKNIWKNSYFSHFWAQFLFFGTVNSYFPIFLTFLAARYPVTNIYICNMSQFHLLMDILYSNVGYSFHKS